MEEVEVGERLPGGELLRDLSGRFARFEDFIERAETGVEQFDDSVGLPRFAEFRDVARLAGFDAVDIASDMASPLEEIEETAGVFVVAAIGVEPLISGHGLAGVEGLEAVEGLDGVEGFEGAE